MTTKTERLRRVESAVIKSRAEQKDGWRIEADIVGFGSKFPTVLTRVPGELASRLAPGGTFNLTLEQQSPKKDGASKPFDYYWGLVGIALETRPDAHGTAFVLNAEVKPISGKKEALAPLRNGSQDSREASIEAQVALKEAWETVRYLMQVEKLASNDDLAIYERLATYLSMGLKAMREGKGG